jgi:hypothetical protein
MLHQSSRETARRAARSHTRPIAPQQTKQPVDRSHKHESAEKADKETDRLYIEQWAPDSEGQHRHNHEQRPTKPHD